MEYGRSVDYGLWSSCFELIRSQRREAGQVGNEKTSVALLSVASNTLLTSSKLVVGFLSGSVSIISEGIHSGIDLLAACIAYFSVRESDKPADSRHEYGHGKIENISGTIEALLIFVAVVLIVIESIRKLAQIINGEDVEVGSVGLSIGLVVMGCSALINMFVSARLMKVAKKTDSVALEADALHLRTDVYTSVGVFVGLLVIRFTGWHIVDPLIALGVALMISKAAYDLVKKAFFPLIDVSLPEEEKAIIAEAINRHKSEFLEFHALRTRKAGAERHVDLHLVVPKTASIAEVHELCDMIEMEISERLTGVHVLIHTEPCNVHEMQCPTEDEASIACDRCQSK